MGVWFMGGASVMEVWSVWEEPAWWRCGLCGRGQRGGGVVCVGGASVDLYGVSLKPSIYIHTCIYVHIIFWEIQNRSGEGFGVIS